MPTQKRREAISDAQIATGGIGLRSIATTHHGTRVGLYAGTVTFRQGPFVGTPIVMLTQISRQIVQGGGSLAPIRVTGRFPGSFTWAGTPKVGTFQYLAIGSYQAR